jgi:hypothetical protein
MFLEGRQPFSYYRWPCSGGDLARVVCPPCKLTLFEDRKLTHDLIYNEPYVQLLSFLSRLSVADEPVLIPL